MISIKYFLLMLINMDSVKCLALPDSCNPGQYYDPGLLACQSCLANSSMVPSPDGFSCSCAEHSVPAGMMQGRCKPCNATEIVSSDGTSCVPRRCQNSSGRFVCRKCPNDYISVTQSYDGSPLKEVLCVKCARGYKVQGNMCARCESCACPKNHIIVKGICIPKTYVNARPKYEDNRLHPSALLDIVKHEYLCTRNDLLACRILASECVRDFYSTDPAGPCRLWIQGKSIATKGLPPLAIESTSNNKNPGQIILPHGKDNLLLVVALFTSNGGLKILQDTSKSSLCQLPVRIKIGDDISHDCEVNISELDMFDFNETLGPFLHLGGDFIQLPVALHTPDGYTIQRGTWPTNKFRRYFMMDKRLSTIANVTNVVYLRTMTINLRIERDSTNTGSLLIHTSIDAQYATKSQLATTVPMSLRVQHEMPSAGVVRSIEIWGGILGTLLALYATVQWRGHLRRGGHYITLVPFLCGSVADALYFSAWFSTLHALAAEAGTLGMTLPLSRSENNIIKAFIYSAVAMKAIKVGWINWNQCQCDIFFLDWSEYNPPMQETTNKSYAWRTAFLAREWSILQTNRRVCTGFTVTFALLIVKLLSPWQSYLPQSVGYEWALACIAWWSGYTVLLTIRWLMDRFLGPPPATLPIVCTGVGLSLLVFQQEYYAHYVHGRNDDDKDVRSLVSPLATCRVVCAPQVRLVYKQLLNDGPVSLGESESRQALLSRFLAAFFERALDGLSWVASERTVLERLLDVELTVREAGNTSTLLYDPDNITPSCVAVTWWGEEWSLATFDNMLFSSVLISVNDSLIAALVTIISWQTMKRARMWFGNRNQFEKTGFPATLFD